MIESVNFFFSELLEHILLTSKRIAEKENLSNVYGLGKNKNI